MLGVQDTFYFREREIRLNSHKYSPIGFSTYNISNLCKAPSKLDHRGCINTAKWNKSGTKLITGSDDRQIKIWDASGSFHNMKLLNTIATQHRGNIFCADFKPDDENVVVSCAADGALCYNDVTNPRFGSRILMTTSFLMHMFIFDLEQPSVIYTAEECGDVSRVDLRATGHQRLYRNKRQALGSSVKALLQSPCLGSHYLFVGGSGFDIDLFDIRLLPAQQAQSNRRGPNGRTYAQTSDNYAIKVYNPLFPSSVLKGEIAATAFRAPRGSTDGNTFTRAQMSICSRDVSVSGLHVSKDGRTLLANYQGDQIYTFDIFDAGFQARGTSSGNTSSSGSARGVVNSFMDYEEDSFLSAPPSATNKDEIASKYVGASAVYGGHFNYSTFLKTVSFFGPNDEYIVSGCDSGYLWVWDTASGKLVDSRDLPPSSQFCADPTDNNVIRPLVPVVSDSTISEPKISDSSESLNLRSIWPTEREQGEAIGVTRCKVLNLLIADNRTCNGVIPHPTAPVLVSYGIDKTAKVWLPYNIIEDDPDMLFSHEIRMATSNINYLKRFVSFFQEKCRMLVSSDENSENKQPTLRERFRHIIPLVNRFEQLHKYHEKIILPKIAYAVAYCTKLSLNELCAKITAEIQEYLRDSEALIQSTNEIKQELLSRHSDNLEFTHSLDITSDIVLPKNISIPKPGQMNDVADYSISLQTNMEDTDSMYVSFVPKSSDCNIYILPKLLNITCSRLKMRGGRSVFDHRQFLHTVAMIRKSLCMNYTLPASFRLLDEGPDAPSDLMVEFRIEGLPVHKILNSLLPILDNSGFKIPADLVSAESIAQRAQELIHSASSSSSSSSSSATCTSSATSSGTGASSSDAASNLSDQQSFKRSRVCNKDSSGKDSTMDIDSHTVSAQAITGDPSCEENETTAVVGTTSSTNQKLDDESWRILALSELYRLASKAKANGNIAMKEKNTPNIVSAIYFYRKAKEYCKYISSMYCREESAFWSPFKTLKPPVFSPPPPPSPTTPSQSSEQGTAAASGPTAPAAGSSDESDGEGSDTPQPLFASEHIAALHSSFLDFVAQNSHDPMAMQFAATVAPFFGNYHGEDVAPHEDDDDDNNDENDDDEDDEEEDDDDDDDDYDNDNEDDDDDDEGDVDDEDDEDNWEDMDDDDDDDDEDDDEDEEDEDNHNDHDVHDEYDSYEESLELARNQTTTQPHSSNSVDPVTANVTSSSGAVTNSNEKENDDNEDDMPPLCSDSESDDESIASTPPRTPLEFVVKAARKTVVSKMNEELMAQSCSNLIAAYIAKESFGEGKQECDELAMFNRLRGVNCDAKFWYRKGVCHAGLGQPIQARDCFQQALVLQPDDALVKKKLMEVKKQIEDQNANSKKFFSKMFPQSNS